MIIWIFLDVGFHSRCIPINIDKSISITRKSRNHFASLTIIIAELIAKCRATQYSILCSWIGVTPKIIRIEIRINIWPCDHTAPCGNGLINVSKSCTIISSTECERFYINTFVRSSSVAGEISRKLYIEICMILREWWINSRTAECWATIDMIGLDRLCGCISWESDAWTRRCIGESRSICIEACRECKCSLCLGIHVSLENALNSLFFTCFVEVGIRLKEKISKHNSEKCNNEYEYEYGTSVIA